MQKAYLATCSGKEEEKEEEAETLSVVPRATERVVDTIKENVLNNNLAGRACGRERKVHVRACVNTADYACCSRWNTDRGPWKPFVADRENLSGSRGRGRGDSSSSCSPPSPISSASSSSSRALFSSSPISSFSLPLLLLLLRRVSLESRMHGTASRFLAPSRNCSSNTRDEGFLFVQSSTENSRIPGRRTMTMI